MNKGKLIIFSGPSGVGKATIEKGLFKDENLKLKLSCSATTRKSRAGEVHGKHYYFIEKNEFNEMVKKDMFVEWNEHFSNKYGTLKSEIKKIMDDGKNPFLEVETNGAINIMKQYNNEEIISIFIKPPSVKELENRIRARGTETEAQIKERTKRVKEEMELSKCFQYVVENDAVEKAISDVSKIIKKELKNG